jgi:hypothetical protein
MTGTSDAQGFPVIRFQSLWHPAAQSNFLKSTFQFDSEGVALWMQKSYSQPCKDDAMKTAAKANIICRILKVGKLTDDKDTAKPKMNRKPGAFLLVEPHWTSQFWTPPSVTL